MKRKLIQTALALLVVSFLLTAPRAQQTPPAKQSPEDRVALYQALLDLTNPWTVMCIAAHPDDEDGTSLIVMRRKYGAHTVSLFTTFGEGGQNAIGPELYEEMGAIRARETMAAAEIQGSEPHFLGLKDFGFSKSADEAFKFWGHDEALRRMVLQIRKLRPDVIITNHSATSNDHGHHQATARLVVEAFDAAADSSRFPEQLNDAVTTWQVQRLFVRVRGNQTPAADAAVVTINPNDQDPIRGLSYAEEALRALQQHATQGPWPKTLAEMAMRLPPNMRAPGQRPLFRYALARGAKGADPLPADSRNFLDGLRLPQEEANQLSAPTIDGKPLTEFVDERERLIKALTTGDVFGEPVQSSNSGVSEQRRVQMKVRFNSALSALTGVSAKLSSNGQILVPGETASFELELANKGKEAVRIDAIAAGLRRESRSDKDNVEIPVMQPKAAMLNAGATTKIPITFRVPQELTVTVPHSKHLYEKNFAGVPVVAGAYVEFKQKKFTVGAERLFDATPSVDIAEITPAPIVIRPDEVGVSSAGADVFPAKLPELRIQLINYLDQRFNGEVVFGLKNQREQTRRKVELLPHQIATLALPMPSPQKSAAHARSSAPAEALSITVRATKSRENITTREVPIVRVNAHVARSLLVGYIRGFDYSLPNALNVLGVESKELSADEVKTADLSKFTSFIVDNRVYESQPELIAANQKLLDYANAGGTLIVCYHKSNEWNPDERRNRPQQLAPYKLILGGERITDETAPITFLDPQHPLLNSPNKMGQEDFANWIQERGLYYPREWDPQYHALLQSNDPGEAPLKGGLLVADYGRGHYIYSSMVWYRQLRAGVPGAYRMLANMVSYGAAEGKSKK